MDSEKSRAAKTTVYDYINMDAVVILRPSFHACQFTRCSSGSLESPLILSCSEDSTLAVFSAIHGSASSDFIERHDGVRRVGVGSFKYLSHFVAVTCPCTGRLFGHRVVHRERDYRSAKIIEGPWVVAIGYNYRVMNHPMETLARGASELGLELTGQQLDQFHRYYQALTCWNQRVNLTAITDFHEVQVKHFLDSLTVLLALPACPGSGARLVDVGAGGGFPGVPLKLVFPDSRLSLVESSGKKARFLDHLVQTLGLSGVEVLTGRAETLAHLAELREDFDVVLSRGVARMPLLLEYTLPFCRVGGRVITLKHGGIEQEMAGAARSMETLGGRLAGVFPVQVGGLSDNRVVVAVEKVGPTPEQYPRRPGIPAKRPL